MFPTQETYTATEWEFTILKWHYRCRHLSWQYLRHLAQRIKGMEELRDIPLWVEVPMCNACMRAKTKEASLEDLHTAH